MRTGYQTPNRYPPPPDPQSPLSEKRDTRHEQEGGAKEACKAQTNLLNGPSILTCYCYQVLPVTSNRKTFKERTNWKQLTNL